MKVIGNLTKDATIRAVASGTLPCGKPVVVNADGTVSVAGETSVSQAVGTPTTFQSGNTEATSAAYDANAQKVVVAYLDEPSQHGKAVVGTVSGNAISFGTPVTFQASNVDWNSVVYDANAQKIVIVYEDGVAEVGKAIVGTVSGTSISFGSAATFDASAAYYFSATYDANAQKIVIFYSDGSNHGRAIVGTVSGTSISFGSATVYRSASVTWTSSTFDSLNNKVVVAFRGNTSGYGEAMVGTVSGTGISFGSATIFSTQTSGGTGEISAVFDSSANKVVIGWQDGTASNKGAAVVGTVSGTSISFGSKVFFADSASGDISGTFDSNANKVVFFYRDNSNSNQGTLNSGTVSGTSITFGTETIFETGATYKVSSTFDANAQKVVVAYRDNNDSLNGKAAVYQPSYISTNLTSENYIGIADGVVKTFSQSEAIGTESTFGTGDVYNSVSGYHVAEKKTLLMFQDYSDSNKLKGRLVTSTGTTLSYGSFVEVTGQVGFPSGVAYDSINEKLVVTFRGNSNYAYAVIATISGSSLTFGTPVVLNSATTSVYPGVYDTTSGKIIVGYAGSGGGTGKLKVGSVSGTSISFGSETSLSQGVYNLGLAHDPSSNKTVVVGYTTANNGKVWLGTVSGTSISVGSPTALPVNPAGIYGVFYDPPSGKVGMILQSGAGPGEALVATVSGDSISFGSEVEFQSGITDGSAGYDSRVNKFIVACRSISSPYPGLLRVGTISGNTFSFASPVTFNSGTTAPHSVGFDSNQGTSIISFMDSGDGDKGKAIGFRAAGSYELSSSVADGDSAVINSTCTVDSNQSGLTAGQQYFVQTDGTLGLTPADPSVFAGTAVSATKLIVKG